MGDAVRRRVPCSVAGRSLGCGTLCVSCTRAGSTSHARGLVRGDQISTTVACGDLTWRRLDGDDERSRQLSFGAPLRLLRFAGVSKGYPGLVSKMSW